MRSDITHWCAVPAGCSGIVFPYEVLLCLTTCAKCHGACQVSGLLITGEEIRDHGNTHTPANFLYCFKSRLFCFWPVIFPYVLICLCNSH